MLVDAGRYRPGHHFDARLAHGCQQVAGQHAVEVPENGIVTNEQGDFTAECVQHTGKLHGDVAAADNGRTRRQFGKLEKADLKGILDLEPREVAILAPLLILVLWMGLWPQPFLDVMDASVTNLLQNYQTALSAAGNIAVVGR